MHIPKVRLFIPYVLIFFGLLLVSFVMSASVLNYSIWSIDEQAVVVSALGMIDYDFNPRWFGYHSLPFYILSFLYMVIYFFYSVVGLVASKIEFTSLLFSNDAVFYIGGRLLCSFLYILGCFVLSQIFYKSYRSKVGAAVLFVIMLFHQDAVAATTNIRVDTFVFLFLSLTVYFSCFAPKKLSSFIFSIMFCCAAFTSKMPAIMFFPVLYAKLIFDIIKREYPRKYLVGMLVLPPLFVFLFMPYIFIDNDTFYVAVESIFKRASGTYVHIGKEHHYSLVSKIGNFLQIIIAQLGILPLVGSVLFALLAIVKKRTMIFPVLFVAAYCAAFITSATLDRYWLRPVYSFLVLFAVMLIWEVCSFERIKLLLENVSKRVARGRYNHSIVVNIVIVLFAISFLSFHSGGLKMYARGLSETREDTRVIGSRWIQENIPERSRIILAGVMQHYVPRVYAIRRGVTLRNSYLNHHNAVLNSKILTDGFQFYCDRARESNRKFRVTLAKKWGFFKKHSVNKGDYIVISSASYDRYYRESVIKQFPQRTRKARVFYDFIKEQKLVKKIEGRGPSIDIYTVK